ncbi:MAG: aryl-sulfate sulfotransferase [Candidatus Aminicenantes bacterium]|nr:aryl-sulfate sulfotransferase [Candidatus Aminicenantes bacterium]
MLQKRILRQQSSFLLACMAASLLCLTIACVKVEETKEANEDELEKLRALPYLEYSEEKADEKKVGVVFYNPARAYEGVNLYDSTLMDMEGNIVKAWPWMFYSFLLDGGVLLGQGKDETLFGKYTWESQPVWEKKIHNHHDIAITAENTILIPSREVKEYNGRKVAFDTILELSQAGEELSHWSTWDHFEHLKQFHKKSALDKPFGAKDFKRGRLKKMFKLRFGNLHAIGADYDYYHLNSIQVVPENKSAKKDKKFQKGNWLICFKHVDLVLILDKDTKNVVWNYGTGVLAFPHMPRMLENGNILIYDNGTKKRRFSRVIEVDPLTKEIVWEYTADPPESFFSPSLGAAQRLPNNNTLITDSMNGRAFEVTKEGEIVWEWYKPQFKKGTSRRAVVYRMIRYQEKSIERIMGLN